MESAIQAARRSNLKSFQTGAVIFQGASRPSKCIGTGWSHYNEAFNLAQYRSIHAEFDAVFNSTASNLNDATIYIATIRRKSGNIGLSRPCATCLDLLAGVGIDSVFFSVENGKFDRISIEEEMTK